MNEAALTADGSADTRPDGPHVARRTVRIVFANATDGYAAVDELRARGYRIDISASIAGDLVVSIQAARAQADEITALVALHDGRIEHAMGNAARS